MNVYIVQAYRFSDYERHSYVAGVYSSKDDAMRAAKKEEEFRGGKYGCIVHTMELDRSDTEHETESSPTVFFEKENYELMKKSVEDDGILHSKDNDSDWSISLMDRITYVENKSGGEGGTMTIRIPEELTKRIINRISGSENDIDNISLVWDNTK